MTARCLVIENDPADDACRLGEWLTGAGLQLHTVRAHRSEPIPADLDGYSALVVLGGDQHVYLGAPWFPALEALLRKAVRVRVPTLGICLGAQLLAAAHAGTVAPATAGPELGLVLVAKRDAAEKDPLFGPVPMLPDVIAWHTDEVSELPHGATLLATSPSYPNQAFRIGDAAWGLQFHIEADAAMVARWAAHDGVADEVVAGVAAALDDLFEVWHPFAHRFAQVALGELALAQPAPRPGRELPLLHGDDSPGSGPEPGFGS